MDNEMGSARGGRRLRSVLPWIGALAAIAGIVGVVVQVIEHFGSRATPSAESSATATPTTPSTPTKEADRNEQFIQAGQCVRNVGSADSPVYEIATCGSGTLRVLARIEQAIDSEAQADALCAKEKPDFTEYHYSNWAKRSDYPDIVFCFGPA